MFARFGSVVLLLVWAAASEAQCSSLQDLNALHLDLRSALRCRDRQLRHGVPGACASVQSPACAGTLIEDVVRLAYGDQVQDRVVDRVLQRDSYRCQRSIARSAMNYVGRRLAYLKQGIDPTSAAQKAENALFGLSQHCDVPVQIFDALPKVPAVGSQCAAAIGAAGSRVHPGSLRNCLRTLLDRWFQRAIGSPPPPRPNIILILSDDQRWDTTDGTHAPAGELIMPQLHAELGGSGVRFRNAFMTTPLCCPSRASLLRGQYAHNTGVHSNAGGNGGAHAFDDSVSLGTLLRSAGYRTGFYGKYLNAYDALWADAAPPYVPPGWDEWHVFKNPQYFNYTLVRNGTGFDHVEQTYGATEAEYSTDVLRELAKQFIQSAAGSGQPFFLYLAPKAPHLPRTPAPRHLGKYTNLINWRPESYNEQALLVGDMPQWVRNTGRLTLAERDALDATRRSQLEMLQAVDELIGGSVRYGIEGIMPLLRRLGIADQTLVVYMSDNGYMWGEHRQQAKNKPYEEAIRTPLFIRYPPLVPLQRVDDSLVLNIDLCPTFAALAGVAALPNFDGHSLENVLDGTARDWRSDFATEGWALGREWLTVREARWKYSETTDSRSLPEPPLEAELYDVVSDPLEQRNVATFPEQAERVQRMAARMRQIRPAWPQDAVGEPEDDE